MGGVGVKYKKILDSQKKLLNLIPYKKHPPEKISILSIWLIAYDLLNRVDSWGC